jgi:DNA modification methylase
MYQLINDDNLKVELGEVEADLIYCDCIYESMDFRWIDKYWKYVKSGGVFIVQTDWHTVCEIGCHLKTMPGAIHVNKIAWKAEWGNHPKDRFHQSYDDILIFSKGKHTKFYADRVQIPKATAQTRLNPSGRMTKTSTAFIDDICLTTTSKERIRGMDGHLIRWQKPVKLMQRIFDPFTDVGDLVIAPFMGSSSCGAWCVLNGRNYIGIENDTDVFGIAKDRLDNINHD